jgi:hypothetical protein
MRIEDSIAEGMSPKEARRDAVLRFGNPTFMKERTVAEDAVLSVESLVADVRYAFRQLLRNRGFAVIAILTLALGIDATTGIFSILNTWIIQPVVCVIICRTFWNYLSYYPGVQELSALSAEDRELALGRFRLLKPHLEWGRKLRSVADGAGVSLRTLQRWVACSSGRREAALRQIIPQCLRQISTHATRRRNYDIPLTHP